MPPSHQPCHTFVLSSCCSSHLKSPDLLLGNSFKPQPKGQFQETTLVIQEELSAFPLCPTPASQQGGHHAKLCPIPHCTLNYSKAEARSHCLYTSGQHIISTQLILDGRWMDGWMILSNTNKRSELPMDVANVSYPFTSLCSSPYNVLLGAETMSYFCVHLGTWQIPYKCRFNNEWKKMNKAQNSI